MMKKVDTPKSKLNVSVAVSEFLTFLDKAKHICLRNPVSPVLASFRLEVDGTNSTSAFVTDLESGLLVNLTTEVKSTGAVCLSVLDLLKIVRTLSKQASLAIIEKSNGWADVSTANEAVFTLPSFDADDYPALPDTSKLRKVATLPCKDFLAGLSTVKHAASQDNPMRSLASFHLGERGGKLTLTATNGHMLASAQIPSKPANLPEKGILLSVKAGRGLEKLLCKEGNLDIFCNTQAVAFEWRSLPPSPRVEGFFLDRKSPRAKECSNKFIVRLAQADFPDYMRIVPAAFSFSASVDREALLGGIHQVSLLASRWTHPVIMKVENDGALLLRSNSPEMGEAKQAIEYVSVGGTSGDLEIGFNAGYLCSILRMIPTKKVILRFNNAWSPVRFEAVGAKDEFVWLISPMRI